jgi:hypothetical protein
VVYTGGARRAKRSERVTFPKTKGQRHGQYARLLMKRGGGAIPLI